MIRPGRPKLPYKTAQIRVPLQVLAQVMVIINQFKATMNKKAGE